jgi:hypothetical protein
MNLIMQSHSRGCGPAALAMLMERSYESVCDDFGVDFEEQGLYLTNLDEYLVENGFSIARKYFWIGVLTGSGRAKRDIWPVPPSGRPELCEVKVYESSPIMHFVVRRPDGIILDPLLGKRQSLDEYFQVLNIAAVYGAIRDD